MTSCPVERQEPSKLSRGLGPGTQPSTHRRPLAPCGGGSDLFPQPFHQQLPCLLWGTRLFPVPNHGGHSAAAGRAGRTWPCWWKASGRFQPAPLCGSTPSPASWPPWYFDSRGFSVSWSSIAQTSDTNRTFAHLFRDPLPHTDSRPQRLISVLLLKRWRTQVTYPAVHGILAGGSRDPHRCNLRLLKPLALAWNLCPPCAPHPTCMTYNASNKVNAKQTAVCPMV